MADEFVPRITRRAAIRLISLVPLFAAFSTLNRASAQDQTALLVSQPSALGENFERLSGARICAGTRAGATGSAFADALRERGATVIIINVSELYTALQTGACTAALFVGDDYNTLERDVRTFFPGIGMFEFRPYYAS